jgi:SPP1 family predicted phage head-tail adaptor
MPSQVPISQKRTRVVLQIPAAPVPDGDGNFTQAWADLDPAHAQAHVVPATARNLERAGAGTTLALASHLITIWYRPDVTTKTRVVVLPNRVWNVVSVTDPNNDQRELELLCAEVVP